VVATPLNTGDRRDNVRLRPPDALTLSEISEDDTLNETVTLDLPDSWTGNQWEPRGIHPIEVIDGQHRLWAFDEDLDAPGEDYFLPVVAFHSLDISWQALPLLDYQHKTEEDQSITSL
jgi:hypothetical protein